MRYPKVRTRKDGSVIIPKGWRRLRNGTKERPGDRFCYPDGQGPIGGPDAWVPLEQDAALVSARWITIRKVK